MQRAFRMAYCSTVTFHDATGAALHTIRQGAIPSVDPVDLWDRLLADAVAILEQRADLRVVLLSDGAPEMRTLLRSALDEAALGTTVSRLARACATRCRQRVFQPRVLALQTRTFALDACARLPSARAPAATA